MVVAKVILIPLAFALLLSFILYPISRKLESWGINKLIAAVFSILVLIIVLGGVIFFFSNRIIDLSSAFTDFQTKISTLVSDIFVLVNGLSGKSTIIDTQSLITEINNWMKESGAQLIGKTFNSTATFFTQLLGTFIYTFLLLIDRHGLVTALNAFAKDENKTKIKDMFSQMQKVGQMYLSGVLTIILVLGIVNSIALWIIGIDHPFLFGFLAASFTVIPYVGTTLGASIAVLYAFMTHDSLWIPFSVALLFWVIQLVESNFLSPKIIGGHVHVNALASILALIVGAMIWGIAGMILFLPFTAMLKVACEHFDNLKPIALLIGTENYQDQSERSHPLKKLFLKLKGIFAKQKK